MSDHPPLVSVVVPTLDAARYVDDTIASLEAGERDGRRLGTHRLEVIVVDGGSSDRTVERFERSSLADLTIEVRPDLNQAAAINHGFALASGEILAWLNGDDTHWDGALAFAARAFTADPRLGFLYGNAVAMDPAGRHYGARRHVRAADLDVLLDDDVIVQPASFWRRRTWDRHGPLDDRLDYVFDYDFFLRVAASEELRYVDVALAGERLHGATKTSGGGTRRIAELEHLMEVHAGQRHVPESFVGEAASVALRDALARLRSGDRSARADLRGAVRGLGGQAGPGVARLMLSTIGGERLFLRALLALNAVESLARRRPLRPGPALA